MKTKPDGYIVSIYNYPYSVVQTEGEAKKMCALLDEAEESDCSDYNPFHFGKKVK